MKAVALVGFSGLTMYGVHNLSADVDIWSINHLHKYDIPPVDRAFEMHSFDNINSPNYHSQEYMDTHIAWLKQEHDFPIYMLEAYPEYPSSVRYPIEEMLPMSSKKRFACTFHYMIAMAIAEGYEQIYIYGFDMATNTEYSYQVPGSNFWIGYAEGKGIEIIAAPESLIIHDRKLYGFENEGMIPRQVLETFAVKYDEEKNDCLVEMHQWTGILADRGESDAPQERINEAFNAVQHWNIKVARADACGILIRDLIDTCDLKE